MDEKILDFAMIASVLIGFFLSIALLTTSFYKSRANNYLALSLFLIACLTYLEWYGLRTTHIAIQILDSFKLDFLIAATLFTYFLFQIKHPLPKSRQYKWIYLPFLGSVLIEISMYFFNLYGSYFDILVWYAKDFASMVFNVCLIFWGRRFIRKSKAISEDKRSWLLRLNLFITGIIVFWILSRIEFYLFDSLYTYYTLWILLSLFLWWVLYHGIFRLQAIVQKKELHAYLVSKSAVPRTKNHITHRKGAAVSEMITRLYRVMEEEELYKDPLLSRLDLATRLGTSESYLSQIINQEINKSVIQFVNDYRIEAAKKLLHTPAFDKYAVEAIGLEAGFKSKSAFYTVFKSSLAMSPGAYRKLPRTS
ncbi:helix-turn-helix domain-containing protein [Maribacter sp. 2307UL18-2]|uniref:helix-turn-helix domain-containing protein n=1 Tax=Maribacter sp. 2307UL18-2 TaxID=3386274 RepID=UPI0039BCC508